MRRIICGVWMLATFALASLSAQPAQRTNLGPHINAAYSELNPVLTSDNQMLFFTRKADPRNVGTALRPDDEDIWFSIRGADGAWGDAVHLEGPLNTGGYDGVRAVNKSVTRLYLQNQYFLDGRRAKGFSVSEIGDDGIWKFPIPLEIENYYNDTTIATMNISNDENVLIFALKRKDSKGGHDLYVSFRRGPYAFTEPQNITELSTAGDEVAPFIGFDDQTIYFPTTGWDAENGLHDVFVTHRLDSTWLHWSKPERLPWPINSPSSDIYFTLSARGDTAYLASWDATTTRGYGRSDIWQAPMSAEFRPGTYLPRGGGQKPTEDVGPTVGSLIRLENVYFDVSKATLRSESTEMLDTLVKLMNKYPMMEIEIQGHTDSDGAAETNLALSQGRAESMVAYLVAHGVAPGRLRARGYGETMPIAPNTTSEGKQLNRRVMIQIAGYGWHEGS